MYISLIILIPTLICLCVYILILIKQNIAPNTSTSIELNIIDKVFTNPNVKNNGSVYNTKSDNVSKKKNMIHVPKFMLELYEKNKVGITREKPDIVRSLIPIHAGPLLENEVLQEYSDNHLIIFDLPTSDEGEIFVEAELKILTLLDVTINKEIGVRRILKISVYDEKIEKLFQFQETEIHHFNSTWVSFDVTAPVSDILQTSSKNKILKIVITVSAYLPSISDNLKLSLMPVDENFEHDYPILLLSYCSTREESTKRNTKAENKINNNREKRSLEDDYEEETNKLWDDDISKKAQTRRMRKNRNPCRRKPLYIDFAEIKYDVWIVQPPGYDAYQCQGRCFYPVAEHLNPTKHAIVQALLHSVAPSRASKSCCVPTDLDSISILYVDNNGVLTYRYAYKDMVVVECGCR